MVETLLSMIVENVTDIMGPRAAMGYVIAERFQVVMVFAAVARLLISAECVVATLAV